MHSWTYVSPSWSWVGLWYFAGSKSNTRTTQLQSLSIVWHVVQHLGDFTWCLQFGTQNWEVWTPDFKKSCTTGDAWQSGMLFRVNFNPSYYQGGRWGAVYTLFLMHLEATEMHSLDPDHSIEVSQPIYLKNAWSVPPKNSVSLHHNFLKKRIF